MRQKAFCNQWCFRIDKYNISTHWGWHYINAGFAVLIFMVHLLADIKLQISRKIIFRSWFNFWGVFFSPLMYWIIRMSFLLNKRLPWLVLHKTFDIFLFSNWVVNTKQFCSRRVITLKLLAQSFWLVMEMTTKAPSKNTLLLTKCLCALPSL